MTRSYLQWWVQISQGAAEHTIFFVVCRTSEHQLRSAQNHAGHKMTSLGKFDGGQYHPAMPISPCKNKQHSQIDESDWCPSP
jgi:hypothetical protein